MSRLRRLQPAGISAFSEYLALARRDPQLEPPYSLLEDTVMSESLGVSAEASRRTFSTRLDAGIYLSALLEQTGLESVERDIGLWSWLSLFYFDELCPPGGHGNRAVKDGARYILEASNFRTYYRHLLAGPYHVVRAHRQHPERTAALLSGQLSTPGELYEQVSSRLELVSNPAFLDAVNRLYYDPKAGSLKRGAGGAGAGSPRRLAQVQRQLELTYDFNSLDSSGILALLPDEFARFKS